MFFCKHHSAHSLALDPNKITRLPGRRGVAAVELALLLPLLVLIFVFTLDFGQIFYGTLTAGNAATNGAYWQVYQNNGDTYPYTSIDGAAKSDTSNLPSSAVAVTSAGDDDGTIQKNAATDVTVRYTFT